MMMRGKYSRHHEQHQQQRSSTFLPMLCSSSSSIKVDQLKPPSHRRCSSTSLSEDPSSPTVGCMGQVKRNNKVVGFPTLIPFTSNNTAKTIQHNTTTNITGSIVKYHKLKRFFSSKSLTTTTATANNSKSSSVRNVNVNREREREMDTRILCRSKIDDDSNISISSRKIRKDCLVNLEELDPPLPVVKRIPKEKKKEENMNLWKRRSRGAPLKSLQVQVIHQPSHLLLPANTV